MPNFGLIRLYQPDDRGKNAGKEQDDWRYREDERIRCPGCIDFGTYLAEDKKHKNNKKSRDPDPDITKKSGLQQLLQWMLLRCDNGVSD